MLKSCIATRIAMLAEICYNRRMDDVIQLAAAITARYGVIKRARGCFLYTARGVRLTDLYQEGGRAILGWGGCSAFTVLKNVLSRGITGCYDTDFAPLAADSRKSQLSRAASALLSSERTVRVFTSKQAALQASLRVAADNTSFYRPWGANDAWADVESVIIEPPLAWCASLWLVALKADCAGAATVQSERVAAPLCAAVTRSLYDLTRAIGERQEKDWFIYDTVLTKYWRRQGPYLFPTVAEERYGDFAAHCLDRGIVISPSYNQPSIVPFGADRGVFRTLEREPFTV